MTNLQQNCSQISTTLLVQGQKKHLCVLTNHNVLQRFVLTISFWQLIWKNFAEYPENSLEFNWSLRRNLWTIPYPASFHLYSSCLTGKSQGFLENHMAMAPLVKPVKSQQWKPQPDWWTTAFDPSQNVEFHTMIFNGKWWWIVLNYDESDFGSEKYRIM